MLRNTLQEEFLRLITGYKASGQNGVNSVLNIQPCYIGLLTSLTVQVSEDGKSVQYIATEPTDPTYERILIGKTTAGQSGTIQVYPTFPTSPKYEQDGEYNIAILENHSQILFPAAEEAYTETIKYIGFYTNDGWIKDPDTGEKTRRTDDSSSGLKLFAKLDEPKAIAKDTIPMFRAKALKISTN